MLAVTPCFTPNLNRKSRETTLLTYPGACLDAKCEENGEDLCNVDGGAKLPNTNCIAVVCLQIIFKHGTVRIAAMFQLDENVTQHKTKQNKQKEKGCRSMMPISTAGMKEFGSKVCAYCPMLKCWSCKMGGRLHQHHRLH